MATPMTAGQYERALRAEGVKVSEMSGWPTHNRNHKGAWGPVNGVLIHHTAGVGSGMASFVKNGYSELPGPLAHGMLSKSATVYLTGYGRANHAGTIAANALNSIIAEDGRHPRPDASEPYDGNSRLYGLEIENRGDGKDPYPAAQYDQAVRWAAAICRFHKWTAESVAGHKEVTRRKIDPSFSMDAFRAKVAERLKHPASWSPSDKPTTPAPGWEPVPGPVTGDDMRLTQLSRPAALTIPAGEDRPVYFTVDQRDDPNEHGAGGYTILSSAAVYSGTVSVWVPASGEDRQKLGVMVVQELPTSPATDSTSSTADIYTEDEAHVAAVSVSGFTVDDRKLKIVLRNYGTEAMVIPRVDVRLVSVAE